VLATSWPEKQSAAARNDNDVVIAHAGILRSTIECHSNHWRFSHSQPDEHGPVIATKSEEKIMMNAKLSIIAIGALVLMANGANAQQLANSRANIRHVSRMFVQPYEYVSQKVPRYQSSVGVYGSYSQGRQSYPNPDRGPYPAYVGAAYY
jgi:hypothetical protein